jgi:hypothetical protein
LFKGSTLALRLKNSTNEMDQAALITEKVRSMQGCDDLPFGEKELFNELRNWLTMWQEEYE